MHIIGSKGGGGTNATAGKEFEDTIQASGTAYVVDLLAEGEIAGLVSGKNSIYFNQIPLQNFDGTSEFGVTDAFFNESTHFKVGEDGDTQTVLPSPYDKTKIPLPLPTDPSLKYGKTVLTNFNTSSYPNITEITVNIGFNSLFRQWDQDSIDKADTYYTDATTASRVAALRTGRNAGDITKSPVHVKIYLNHNNQGFTEVADLVIEHKSSSGFIISRKIVPPIDSSASVQYYTIKVERITKNAKDLKVTDGCFVDSVIVQMDAKFRYPHSALCGLKFDAQTFPSLPDRKYLLDLLKVKVPVNYTPAAYDGEGNRITDPSYAGTWDGTFKTAWTDNPAWVFYDLLTNQRYGLGEYIDAAQVDKWTLYSIAQYCDAVDSGGTFVGVDDGAGGTEQRFTCNLLLTTTDEAYTVVKYLSSVFRGITYWMSGLIFPVQDRYKEPVQLFTNANVIEGSFNYSSTDKLQRRTVIAVRWNDPDDFYIPKIEYVEDQEGILKYGVRQGELAAFACTSRGQAHRVGKWTLLTEKLENEVVTFQAGNEGIFTRPGDVIEIYDDFRLQQKFGGRVRQAIDNTTVLLDRLVTMPLDPSAYSLTLTVPQFNRDPSKTGSYGVNDSDEISEIRTQQREQRAVDSVEHISGQWTQVTVASSFTDTFTDGIWSLSVTNTGTQEITGAELYRILSISESDEKTLEFTAINYDTGKFGDTETNFTVGVDLDNDYSQSPIGPPSGLQLSVEEYNQGGDFAIYIQSYWVPSTGSNVVRHVASGRLEGSDWEELVVDVETDTGARYYIYETGLYEIAVKALQAGGALSTAISGAITGSGESPYGTGSGAVVPLSGITLNNHDFGFSGRFSEKEPEFSFPFLATGENGTDDRFLTTLGVVYYLFDSEGTQILRGHTLGVNESVAIPYEGISSEGDIITGWPQRDFRISGKAFDIFGNTSEGVYLDVENPAPATGATITFPTRSLNAFNYSIVPVDTVNDLSGVNFYISGVNSKPDDPFTTIASLNGAVTHNLNTTDLYIWFEIADTYATTGLITEGPFQYNSSSTLTLPDGFGITGEQIIETGEYGNDVNSLRMYWSRFTGDSIYQYELEVATNTSTGHYIVAHTSASDDDPEYLVTNIPAIEFSGRVRGMDIFGASSTWSSFSNIVTGSEPTIRFLDVSGSGHFERHTNVKLFNTGLEAHHFGSVNLDFGISNMMNLSLGNTGTVTLQPQNVISGATYMLRVTRASGTGALVWGSNFYWSNSGAPETPTSAGYQDVLSFAAFNDTIIHGVQLPNFGPDSP